MFDERRCDSVYFIYSHTQIFVSKNMYVHVYKVWYVYIHTKSFTDICLYIHVYKLQSKGHIWVHTN